LIRKTNYLNLHVRINANRTIPIAITPKININSRTLHIFETRFCRGFYIKLDRWYLVINRIEILPLE